MSSAILTFPIEIGKESEWEYFHATGVKEGIEPATLYIRADAISGWFFGSEEASSLLVHGVRHEVKLTGSALMNKLVAAGIIPNGAEP